MTVIIITLARPDYVRRCLTCLAEQVPAPDQIIVIDASPDDQTRQVVAAFPGVVYLRNENGVGRMTASRNIGLRAARGQIIAFLDDDAFAHPGWLAALQATYTAPDIGAVGGRALNHQPGEATQGVDAIGRLLPNGTLTGHFAADPGRIIRVDHIMGCNMSFRREVLARLGGFREDYPGVSGLREDTDMCLRVTRLGYRILFNPAACVDHLGAPQVQGQRFDTRYTYYGMRNHLCMLIRNFGLENRLVWRYMVFSGATTLREFARRIGGAFARLGATGVGTGAGLAFGLALRLKTGADPVRHDAMGQAITRALSTADGQTPVAPRLHADGTVHEVISVGQIDAL